MKPMMNVFGAVLVAALAFGWTHSIRAEEDPKFHNKDGSMKMPENYADAVAGIEHHTETIQKAIKDGKLDTLHKHGEEVKMLALMLAKLASKPDSKVAEGDIKEINLTAKKLAATYEPLDEAGDAGKKAESQKVCDEIVALTAVLKKFVK